VVWNSPGSPDPIQNQGIKAVPRAFEFPAQMIEATWANGYGPVISRKPGVFPCACSPGYAPGGAKTTHGESQAEGVTETVTMSVPSLDAFPFMGDGSAAVTAANRGIRLVYRLSACMHLGFELSGFTKHRLLPATCVPNEEHSE